MIRRRARTASTRARPSRHGRHGREDRSPVVRPPLPPLETRAEKFDLAVGTAVEFLRSAWPELRDVRFGDVALGDLDAHLSPWLLLLGRARIELDSDVDTPTRAVHGAIGVSRTGVRADDLNATIAPGRLFAPLPVTGLVLEALSVRFENGACVAAEGRVRAMLAGDVAGVAMPSALSAASTRASAMFSARASTLSQGVSGSSAAASNVSASSSDRLFSSSSYCWPT